MIFVSLAFLRNDARLIVRRQALERSQRKGSPDRVGFGPEVTARDASSQWRKRGPRIVVAAFCTLIFACALLHPGHGCESVDVRTYAQMIGVMDAARETKVPPGALVGTAPERLFPTVVVSTVVK